jgi:DNA-binding transcriptional ArsR family regulator
MPSALGNPPIPIRSPRFNSIPHLIFFKNICASKYLPIYLQAYTCIMIVRRDAFQAIADPTRRRIIDMVADKPLTVNTIAESFHVSRQAISLHIKILIECELLTITKQGRERYCSAQLDQLSEVSVWVAQYKQHWESKLDNLATYLDQLKKERKHGK